MDTTLACRSSAEPVEAPLRGGIDGVGPCVGAVQFVATMSASADVLALANAEFEIGDIPVGQSITVKWRGKPIFIRHRTKAEIDKEAAVSMGELRDPEADASRIQNPEW
jgi:ubiquinol-cytochrome c reductase iron-sulfur subunit